MDNLRILIASTEKTGNTWLKLLLAQIYHLPAPHISQDFSAAEADALGERWVTHQHFLPERPLLEWAEARRVHLLTTIRHPGDTLVSLYHYCCNYPDHYKDDPAISAALAADAQQRAPSAHIAHHIVDGELIRVLQERIMCDLNISISWMRSGRSALLRYENLRTEPVSTLQDLTEMIAPVSRDRIEQAVAACELEVLRETNTTDSRFFRRALVGEWRTALPADVKRGLAWEEPFRSQFAFLGYKMEVEENCLPQPACDRGGNEIPFAPIFTELLQSLPAKQQRIFAASRESFFAWANAPAEDDHFAPTAIPRITNLAAFAYKQRPDLQAAFPDIFGANRLGFAAWFLRYAGYRYGLDRSFLTPIALSWISDGSTFSSVGRQKPLRDHDRSAVPPPATQTG